MTQNNTETHVFSAETGKVLQLMIHSLYTNRDIFLRELISNASDACDKRRYEGLSNPALLGDEALRIRISFDASASTLTISDSGIGMSREEMISNLGTIAKSGTQEFLSELSKNPKKEVSLIGQFGVGFYSAFMVAENVSAVSRRAGSAEGWRWESDGSGEFTIAPAEAESTGTSITLHMKDDCREYLDFFRLRHIIQTYSDHISFPIELVNEEGKAETINQASALWARPKSDVTEEQYQEFYRHVAHSPDTPWLTLHHKVEGKLEYTYLLFIPSMRPFDLFHPDRKRRVKLYVKRVFITEEGLDLIPHYLRFLRGVIDSEDLPLNISRETLQANPTLSRIRDAIAKKVLSELKKKAESDPASYDNFWAQFGAVLKEGLCEATTPRESILECCRFHSTKDDALTGLDEYTARMKEGQEAIYYLTGDRLESVRHNPKLEGFRKQGLEVLLLSDHVDDFWLSVVQDYKGKPFKSITRADIDLRNEEEKPEEAQEQETGASELIARMKDILGNEVKDVRTTSKLTDSASCLAVEEGAMDIRLERFLIEQKQLPGPIPKILEINPSHPIVQALSRKLSVDANDAEITDATWLLFEQARLVEGEEIADPAAFARRLNGFLQKSLAA